MLDHCPRRCTIIKQKGDTLLQLRYSRTYLNELLFSIWKTISAFYEFADIAGQNFIDGVKTLFFYCFASQKCCLNINQI